jgi:acylphosphatase
MDNQELVRLHAIIEGHVQGVGYRYFVEENANTSGITGWVRNRWDGSVEVLAEGERASLEELLANLYKGPRSARVLEIKVDWQAATGEFPRFSVRATVM